MKFHLSYFSDLLKLWIFRQSISPLTFLAPRHFLMQPGPLFSTRINKLALPTNQISLASPKTCNWRGPSLPPGLDSPGSRAEVRSELNDAAPGGSAKMNWNLTTFKSHNDSWPFDLFLQKSWVVGSLLVGGESCPRKGWTTLNIDKTEVGCKMIPARFNC